MRWNWFSLVVFLLLPGVSFGQGIPPIKAFTAKNYQAGNQNWGVGQDGEKNMFFANNEGLLHYDGNNRTLYNAANKTIMRSVRALGSRVYTGCYMEFDYWEKDQTGRYSYTSLSENIAGRLVEDEQFWSIHEVEDLVLFQSSNSILSHNI